MIENNTDGAETTQQEEEHTCKLIFVLEQACLDTRTVEERLVLVNPDRHRKYIERKLNKEVKDYRPDITHKALMTILDSPLNKASKIYDILVMTRTGVLIRISTDTILPRNDLRFYGMIANLIERRRIETEDTGMMLMECLDGTIMDHLPKDCLKVSTSVLGNKVKIGEYVPKIINNDSICFFIGAVAEGNPGIENDYADDCIAISRYNLSASGTINRLIYGFEDHLDII